MWSVACDGHVPHLGQVFPFDCVLSYSAGSLSENDGVVFWGTSGPSENSLIDSRISLV